MCSYWCCRLPNGGPFLRFVGEDTTPEAEVGTEVEAEVAEAGIYLSIQ